MIHFQLLPKIWDLLKNEDILLWFGELAFDALLALSAMDFELGLWSGVEVTRITGLFFAGEGECSGDW